MTVTPLGGSGKSPPGPVLWDGNTGALAAGFSPAPARVAGAQATVMTTFPRAWPTPRYRIASAASLSG
jgi:hypothetical protein